jgi:hypothetical protein
MWTWGPIARAVFDGGVPRMPFTTASTISCEGIQSASAARSTAVSSAVILSQLQSLIHIPPPSGMALVSQQGPEANAQIDLDRGEAQIVGPKRGPRETSRAQAP